MTALDLGQELILHGVGSGYMESVTGNVVDFTKGQNMKLDIKATQVEVEGGDSLFPIYTFTSKKEGTITIDSAVFNIAQLQAAQATSINSTSVLKAGRVLGTLATTTLGTNLTGVTNVICLNSAGIKIGVTQTGTAATDGVDVSATGAVTWGATVPAGEYKFLFQSVATIGSTVSLLKNGMAEVSDFHWTLFSENTDGVSYQVDVYAKRVRADGSFSIDAKTGTATVPQLTIKVLNPGDDSSDFVTVTVSKV